jgi:hypothetical protein
MYIGFITETRSFKMAQQVIIKKSEWLRGEGKINSYLYRSTDGKKCCIGFFCEQVLGLDTRLLQGVQVLSQVIENPDEDKYSKWIEGEEVYDLNDDHYMGDEERMEQLKQIAAKHGYDFVFVD